MEGLEGGLLDGPVHPFSLFVCGGSQAGLA